MFTRIADACKAIVLIIVTVIVIIAILKASSGIV